MELITCEELLDPPYFDTSSSSVHFFISFEGMESDADFSISCKCYMF